MSALSRLRRIERHHATVAERRFAAVSARLDAIVAAAPALADRADAVRLRAAEVREGRIAYGWRAGLAVVAGSVDAADLVLAAGLVLVALGLLFVWWPLALVVPGAVLLYIALWHRRIPADAAEPGETT